MASQPGDEAHTMGMDQSVLLVSKLGMKTLELIPDPHGFGDLIPKNNNLISGDKPASKSGTIAATYPHPHPLTFTLALTLRRALADDDEGIAGDLEHGAQGLLGRQGQVGSRPLAS